MIDVPVLYAPSEGQTRRIAERTAGRLAKRVRESRPQPGFPA